GDHAGAGHTSSGQDGHTDFAVEVISRTGAEPIRLAFNATATGVTGPRSSPPVATITMTAICEANIPNGGCLVLEGGPPKSDGGGTCWMLFMTTLVDGQGKPIKH